MRRTQRACPTQAMCDRRDVCLIEAMSDSSHLSQQAPNTLSTAAFVAHLHTLLLLGGQVGQARVGQSTSPTFPVGLVAVSEAKLVASVQIPVTARLTSQDKCQEWCQETKAQSSWARWRTACPSGQKQTAQMGSASIYYRDDRFLSYTPTGACVDAHELQACVKRHRRQQKQSKTDVLMLECWLVWACAW